MDTTTMHRTATSRLPSSVALILGLLVLRTGLLFLADGAIYRASTGPVDAALAYTNVAIVAVDAVTILAVVAALRREGRTLGALIGRISPARTVGWGLVVFAVTSITLLIGTFIGNLIVYQGPPPEGGGGAAPPLWLALWSLLIMPATVAVAEEVLYRGWAHERLNARLPTPATVVIIAAFFGLQHAALSATSWSEMGARVIAAFIAGLAFGTLRAYLRTLGPLILGHWLADVIGLGLPMLLLAVQ